MSGSKATPTAILGAYPKQTIGNYIDSQTISMGLIHQTYRIETSEGLFSLQRLHPKLASDGILQDYEAVLDHLAANHFPAPRLCHTKTGSSSYQDIAGHRWRLTTWCPGQATSTIQSTAMVRSAASLLGRFHATMENIDYAFQSTHPLHDTAYHLRSLQKAAATHTELPWTTTIQQAIQEVNSTLPALILAETLPRRVVHGDPKISNVLFDDQWQAVAMIDLDTCTRHSPLVDLGDAIRSWCRDGAEDQPRPFSLERWQALLEGYLEAAPALTPEEIALLPDAGRLITLELTARFLTDVLCDEYFAWDHTHYASRRDHNWARAQSMLALADEMKTARPAMEAFVTSILAAQTAPSSSNAPTR